MDSWLFLILILAFVESKLNGVRYIPKSNSKCKSTEEIQKDVDVIAELADSVILEYIDGCNFIDVFEMFSNKEIDIFVNINIQSFWKSSQNNNKYYDDIIKIKNFESIKGIILKDKLSKINSTVKVGNFHKIDFYEHNYINRPLNILHRFILDKNYNDKIDFIVLNLLLPSSQIDFSQLQKNLFNDDLIKLQSLDINIYFVISFIDQNNLSVDNFIKISRELTCRANNKLGYFITDNAGIESILNNNKYKRYLKKISKDFLSCEGHTFIGKTMLQC
ncbi:hypothetical protein BB561_004270 [Smittium simulii]|uniref:Uncharacterized protein n=1 Tax=Smittium simulii TaxID=133385 RepID=A0A2T9YH65_9FUNG|nr:hypothetical protein BB561_004270 [Smittium simulii]